MPRRTKFNFNLLLYILLVIVLALVVYICFTRNNESYIGAKGKRSGQSHWIRQKRKIEINKRRRQLNEENKELFFVEFGNIVGEELSEGYLFGFGDTFSAWLDRINRSEHNKKYNETIELLDALINEQDLNNSNNNNNNNNSNNNNSNNNNNN